MTQTQPDSPIKKFPRNKWGELVTPADLPNPKGRWTEQHKENLRAAIAGGLISVDSALERYALTKEELAAWCVGDLKVTKRERNRDGGTRTFKSQKIVTIGGQWVHLSSKEHQVLEILASSKGQAVTKDMIMNRLYGGVGEPTLKIIDVFVCKLRKKLAGVGCRIETLWGRGYVLRDPVEGLEANTIS